MFTEQQMAIFSTKLARAMVREKAQADAEAVKNTIGFKPTEFKPTIEAKRMNELFVHCDESFNAKAQIKTNNWGALGHIAVPPVIENYFFRRELTADVVRHLKAAPKYGLFLTGKKGTGKTSLVEQIAARLGIPVYAETGSPSTEYLDLFGTVLPTVSGKVKFFGGKLYQAMKEGGIFLLDEVDMMMPSELVKMNELFSGKRLFIPQTEEWILPHKDFRIVVTANTNGSGCDGNYVGANVLNEAFMDRFYIVEVEYMREEHEIAFVDQIISDFETANKLSASKEFQKRLPELKAMSAEMVQVARLIRQAAEESQGTVLSLRGLDRWMTLYLYGKDVYQALDMAYANTLDEATREATHEIARVSLSMILD
ncbi:AAA domain-containing protein [Vibrio sp. S11_S32]|uniref:AAA family ATPase n=1 Tax=Vibrio sp. S11_S32 TaxID=2720225 RepID=UPI00168135A6|nr:AAA family ATPase [Vibrio sp. S11_S32]MBD1577665.1 AAA domain-containing protein [Vibrio sp. S11_S32]